MLALVGVKIVVGVMEAVENGLELFVGGVGEENAYRGNLLLHGAICQAVGSHAQVVEGGNAAFLGCIYEKCRLAVDFKEFEVFERAVFHAVQYGFDLFFGIFREDSRKLDGLFYEKEGVCACFARFFGNDIQFHVWKDSKVFVFCCKERTYCKME